MAEAYPSVELSGGPLKRVGGAVALDFVNTVGWRLADEAAERLHSYGDLVAWVRGTGAIDAGRARRIAARAKADPGKADRVLAEARRLRDALFRTFLARSRDKAPAKADLGLINRWLARTAPRAGLDLRGGRLGWRWPDETLESLLAPVLWSAGELLAGDDTARIKLCAADGCGWIFLDASRKANRLWCSMEDCGNRAKAKRHYRRRTSV